MAETQTRVMLVDDHEVVCEGLRTLIGRHKEMLVVGEAATTAEAIETAARTRPDVIVMDIRLPDGSGVEACRTIREALFLSEKTVKNYVSRILDKLGLARRAEAAAYMAKRRPRF